IFLARLHRADCESLERYPAVSMATLDQILQEIENVWHRLNQATGEPAAMVHDLFGWLRTNAPAPPEKPVLLHGDIGFHNLLVEDGKVSVVLDWERAHPGDPAEDLAYLKPTLHGVMPWDDFLDHYESAGGIRPDPQSLEFYTVWQDVWRYVACQALFGAFEKTPRLSSLFAGRIFGPRFLANAVNNSLRK
ncbi:MAG: phosphotransferase, partial [Gammaproteobacteria bacterium]|nr:phosphotransferase [Gammaproteobacteria bacterium]